jgi:hypothetical protein
MSNHEKSTTLLHYEEYVNNTNHFVRPVRVTKHWVNGTFRSTRVTEVPWDKLEKPESAKMSGRDLDNWGSCMSSEDRNITPEITKSFMEFKGLLGKPGTWLGSDGETPSHDKFLPLDDTAWDSHQRDVERVARGEAPTQPSGWVEDPQDSQDSQDDHLTSSTDDIMLSEQKVI